MKTLKNLMLILLLSGCYKSETIDLVPLCLIESNYHYCDQDGDGEISERELEEFDVQIGIDTTIIHFPENEIEERINETAVANDSLVQGFLDAEMFFSAMFYTAYPIRLERK